MKKIFIYVLAGMTLLPMATGCNSLDLESESQMILEQNVGNVITLVEYLQLLNLRCFSDR